MVAQTRFEQQLDEADPDWDRPHPMSVEIDKERHRRRGVCECGWKGRWRTSPNRAWDAICDGDEHANEAGDDDE